MKILIIGVGNMGATYLRCLLSSHFTQAENLFLLDSKPSLLNDFKGVRAENILTVPNQNISEADIILLAVKPQDFIELSKTIQPYLHKEQIVLSIMAGVTISSIAELLGSDKVVRAMPNLPAQVGMGMTVFTSSNSLDKKELFIIQNLLNTTGKTIYVEDESMIDAATAVSGSGPAYVFYFMNAMIEKAIAFGFSKAEAELMVNQTFMGAVHLQSRNDASCEEWIARVASKGGTTEAALNIFNSTQLNRDIADGLQAAKDRAVELGKK